MSKWRIYNGDREKEWCDIILKDGTEILMCWPNANTFHGLSCTINESKVEQIRKSDFHPLDVFEKCDKCEHKKHNRNKAYWCYMFKEPVAGCKKFEE